jgi:hypothetical protein
MGNRFLIHEEVILGLLLLCWNGGFSELHLRQKSLLFSMGKINKSLKINANYMGGSQDLGNQIQFPAKTKRPALPTGLLKF